MSSPEFDMAGSHGSQHFLFGQSPFKDGFHAGHVDHGGSRGTDFDQSALVGRGLGHGDLPSSHGHGAQSNFRTTTDVNIARNTVLSSGGFSFPNASASPNAHREEHKNTDTNISTEEKQHGQQQSINVASSLPENIDNIALQQHQTPTRLVGPNNGITSQPTLLPHVTNNDFHDSNRSASRSQVQQPRLPSASLAITNQTTPFTGPISAENISHFADNSDPNEAFLGQLNMGYNSNSLAENSWREHRHTTAEQKMEHHMIHNYNNNARAATERKEHDDDSTTVRSTDTASLGSPLHGPLHVAPPVGQNNAAAGAQSTATTPSTVSTAPSTVDEGSFALDASALERLALRGESMEANVFHRRGPSWENPSSYQSQLYVQDEADNGAFSRGPNNTPSLPPAQAPSPNAWGNNNNNQQRVASFRNEFGLSGAAPVPQDQRWQQQTPQSQTQPRFESGASYGQTRNPANQTAAYGPYPGPRTQHPPANTPPRTGRTPRGAPNAPNPHRPSPAPASNSSNQTLGSSSSSGNPRSPSEVLKTLLRKKACLYEPDTSRAVALATWLVGRVLALEHGYFSRQQLQAGVHACVAAKIDSGVITRTKVNRCMQIILNSCFHYIIPRPDGTEENGDAFRFVFANEVADDIRLLRELPSPWNDLSVDRMIVLEASAADIEGKPQTKSTSPGSNPTTPQSSPKLGSIPAEKTSPRAKDDMDHDSKRAVLLCFNENVRCAEDVFRCHNEFIRDTAHASGLQLSSNEWRSFFGKEAAGSPHLWGNIGIPVPHSETSNQVDALGMMTSSELSKFRTSWCSKRYDHDHELCGFAHVEVNGGWLRRNPQIHDYKTEMCPHIVQFSSRSQANRRYVVNGCPHGENCQFAHSPEEILYHPRRYKSGLCSSLGRSGGCPRGDVCSDFHPAESYKFPSKKGDGRLNSRQARQGANAGKGSQAPSAAPVLYCSPAPTSRFEEQFHLPGLMNLYRRHCSVMRAHLSNPSCVCCYSFFGDDNGTGNDPAKLSQTFTRGLPQPRGV